MDKKKYRSPQTVAERELAIIWQQLLEKDKIGIDDNFFELGGHSFLAVKVIERINLLGYCLKLKDIFLYQTIAQLSEKATAKNLYNNHKQKQHLISIQKEGDLTPIFVVSSLWAYVQLAAQMGKKQPFFCLDEAESDRIQDMASFYISKIKSIQPRGPYYLGGFCQYGYVALEIARQLDAQGDDVGLLFLFETYSPAGVIARLSWRYLKLSFSKLIRWPSLNRKKYLKDELRQAAKSILCAFVKLTTRRDLVKSFTGKIVLAKPPTYDFTYNGKVVLFRSSTKEIWAKDDLKMGWSIYFSGEIDIYTIEGSHTEIFLAPGVIQLSKIMKKVLENLRKDLTEI